MEIVPFGQDGIPPTAGKATNYRMSCNWQKAVCTPGIEAFNLLKILTYLAKFVHQ
jgi:hypothetical protein